MGICTVEREMGRIRLYVQSRKNSRVIASFLRVRYILLRNRYIGGTNNGKSSTGQSKVVWG